MEIYFLDYLWFLLELSFVRLGSVYITASFFRTSLDSFTPEVFDFFLVRYRLVNSLSSSTLELDR